jgi:hypothetical protein
VIKTFKWPCLGTYKVRNEIETKRNEINKNETKRNDKKPLSEKDRLPLNKCIVFLFNGDQILSSPDERQKCVGSSLAS